MFSSSNYLFASDDKQLLTFYCRPPKGYSPSLIGDYSAAFVDDGCPNNEGDTKKGDNIFTVKISVLERKSKTIEVYAIAKDGLRYFESNHITIEIKEGWSKEEYDDIEVVDKSIQNLLNEDNYKNSNYENKKGLIKNLLDGLSDDRRALINKDSIFFDDKTDLYTFSYKNGELGCVKIFKSKEKDGFLYGETTTGNNSNSQSNSGEKRDCNALIIYDWYTDKDEILSIYKNYQRAWNEKGISTTLSQNPTVAQYNSQLSNNYLILIAAHGSRWSLKTGWFASPVTYSVICTHDACSAEKDNLYKNDIGQKNLVKASTENGQFYWIMPSFFENHYSDGELDNTVMLMDNCNGMGSDGDIDYDLASSLTGKNSAAIGFHNSVLIFKSYDREEGSYYALGYGTNYMQSMANYLISGLSFSEAEEKTRKVYGSNQKIYLESFWGSSSDEDALVFPMIYGNGSAKLNLPKSEKDYLVGNKLLAVDSKFFISDTNAIHMRNSITEQGKMIVDMQNTGQIMSDGETVFFTVSNGYNQANGHEQYDVYSTSIYENNAKKLFSGNYEVNLIACKDNAIYYIDDEPENGPVTYLASLMKYDIQSGVKTVVSGDKAAASACFYMDKIYYSNALLDVSLINRNSVFAYDINTGSTEEVARNSTMSKPSYLRTSDALYFRTFRYTGGKMTYQHIYYVDYTGKLQKSAQFPDNYNLLHADAENHTAIVYDINSSENNTTFSFYSFDMLNGETRLITNNMSVRCFVNSDLNSTSDVYFFEIPTIMNYQTVNMRVYKLVDGNLVPSALDGSYSLQTKSYNCWVIDGFFVNENFECFEISN